MSKGEAVSPFPKTGSPMPVQYVIAALLCIASVLGCLTLACYGCIQCAKSPVDINEQDETVIEMVRRYRLERAIAKYDLVINAIERYHAERGAYPPDLQALVSTYLPQVPGIYIRAGEMLVYSPGPEQVGGAPLTFYAYGHHTGLQFIHGWELKYCPAELGLCGEANDRHYHPHRINDRWIWINRSAL
jgi:hypothetical protein